jgi:hypothetical protein
MQRTYSAKQWRALFAQAKSRAERDALVGLPMNLAARVLGITRGRIYQLIREGKLNSVVVHDELTGVRIAYMITLESLEQRRSVRRNSGQWQPSERL